MRSREPGFLGLVTSGLDKASFFMPVFYNVIIVSMCYNVKQLDSTGFMRLAFLLWVRETILYKM